MSNAIIAKIKNVVKVSKGFQYYMGYKKYLKRYLREGMEKKEASKLVLKNYRPCYFRGNKVEQTCKAIKRIRISIAPGRRYQHWIDEQLCVCNTNIVIGNIPPDYTMVVNSSLKELREQFQKYDNEVSRQNCTVLTAVEAYIDRIISTIESCTQDEQLVKTAQYIHNMKEVPAESLEEALQRILFWSSLFWQMGHSLVGLGRLDVLLDRFAEKSENETEALEQIKDFLRTLHDYYSFKSASLLGDIGQIIILGGQNDGGTYFMNRFTVLFIRAVNAVQVSDPKILLRVSEATPRELIVEAVKCIATGVGSPLLSNDCVVIPKLEEFGYSHAEACNYVTSACWEPVSYGNSLEQNNLININFARSFVDTAATEEFIKAVSFEGVLYQYFQILKQQLEEKKAVLQRFRWEEAPLFTLFTWSCCESGKNIAYGGAKHSNYGVLSVGMANAVNSLLSVKRTVFEEKKYTLKEIQSALSDNYAGTEELKQDLAPSDAVFGCDNDKVIDLTNRITAFVSDNLKDFSNMFGGKVKWGLSSPGYIDEGGLTGATADGRKRGDALSVHISSSGSIAYTELVSFASELRYSGVQSNGNVIDYFVAPSFITKNIEKFILFLELSIKRGFFQMQMNVVSSESLIAARENPDKFPDLIVRVWGFSAYFNDLPDEYKEILIRRAIESEQGI